MNESYILFGAEVVLQGEKLVEACQYHHCYLHYWEGCEFGVESLSLHEGVVLHLLSVPVFWLVLVDLVGQVGSWEVGWFHIFLGEETGGYFDLNVIVIVYALWLVLNEGFNISFWLEDETHLINNIYLKVELL